MICNGELRLASAFISTKYKLKRFNGCKRAVLVAIGCTSLFIHIRNVMDNMRMAYPSLSKAEPFQMQVNKRDAILFAYLNKNSFIQAFFLP